MLKVLLLLVLMLFANCLALGKNDTSSVATKKIREVIILEMVQAEKFDTCTTLSLRAKRVRLSIKKCTQLLRKSGRPEVDGSPLVHVGDMFYYIQGEGWGLNNFDYN